MNILLLGSKEYPFGVSHRYDRKAGGGIEIHAEKLAKYLAREGHDVFVITRRFPGQAGTEKQGNISICRTRFIYNRYLRNFTFNLSAFLKAWKIIRKERIDVIHCHGAVAGFFGALLSRFTGTPMVFTPHGLAWGWPFGIQEILMFFENTAARAAKKTIFISAAAQKKLTRRARFPNTLLSNAVDLDDYSPGARRTWKPVRFLFAGRLEEIKGITYLLDAFKKLCEGTKDSKTGNTRCELWIAGSGTLREYVRNFISENRLGNSIIFLEWRTDVPRLFQSTDAFVLPSWESGQPVALLEALSAGKIIITSLDFIEDGRDGIKTRPRDTDDLHEKMLGVVKNIKGYDSLRSGARKTAERFAWKNVIREFIKEYRNIINQ